MKKFFYLLLPLLVVLGIGYSLIQKNNKIIETKNNIHTNIKLDPRACNPYIKAHCSDRVKYRSKIQIINCLIELKESGRVEINQECLNIGLNSLCKEIYLKKCHQNGEKITEKKIVECVFKNLEDIHFGCYNYLLAPFPS